MKKFIGLFILIIVLVAVSGCSQQATTTPVTTAGPTEVPTVVVTTVKTIVPQTTKAPAETTPKETAIAANGTSPVSETVAVPVPTQIVTSGMTPSTKVTTIHIVNNSFSPSVLMVLPGTGISWINDDSTVHSVKMIGEYAGKFNSGDIAAGSRTSYSFGEAEGTFEYADGHDLNVTGVIIVKKGESFYGMGTPTTYMTSNAT